MGKKDIAVKTDQNRLYINLDNLHVEGPTVLTVNGENMGRSWINNFFPIEDGFSNSFSGQLVVDSGGVVLKVIGDGEHRSMDIHDLEQWRSSVAALYMMRDIDMEQKGFISRIRRSIHG